MRATQYLSAVLTTERQTDKAHRKQQEAEGKQQRGSGKVFDKNAFQGVSP